MRGMATHTAEIFVSPEKIGVLSRLAEKSEQFFSGYERSFTSFDGGDVVTFSIDTRFDEELKQAGVI